MSFYSMWCRNSQATLRQGIIALFPALPDHGGGEEVDAPLDNADVVGLGERGELDVGAEQLEGPTVVDEGTLLRVVEHCGKETTCLAPTTQDFDKNFIWNRGLFLPIKIFLPRNMSPSNFPC